MTAPARSRWAAAGVFALRTPLLAFDELVAWSEGLEAAGAVDDPSLLDKAVAEDRNRLRERLGAVLGRPEVREAIFLGSPDLEEALDVWEAAPEGERGRGIEGAAARYFARMAGRATPFGLFAGTTFGTVADRTRLVVEGRETYRRLTRLDMGYLSAVADRVAREPAHHDRLVYRANSTLYRGGGKVRYVERRDGEGGRTHHLVAVGDGPLMASVLGRAAAGATRRQLAAELSGAGMEPERAEGYVARLIDDQMLVPDVGLVATGHEPLGDLADQLRSGGVDGVADDLDRAGRVLTGLDRAGLGNPPDLYRALAGSLAAPLAAGAELSHLFHLDLVKPAAATLGPQVLHEIVRGAELFHRLARRPPESDLDRFRQAFTRRYEGAEVPLLEALDRDLGVGFGPARRPSPLLEGLTFPPPKPAGAAWGRREEVLLGHLVAAAAAGAAEVVLTDHDLEAMADPGQQPLPSAFAVTAIVAAASQEALDRGRFQVLVRSVLGPSGALMLGRFCHLDPGFKAAMDRHLRDEEALDPDAVFAEIAHLPHGHVGNVVVRPLLRDHEIVYLGRSGAPPEGQIPMSDLLVSVAGGRVVLRSARLDRRVVPRLSCAHNYNHKSPPAYRFLCALQVQGVAGRLFWDWGPLRNAPFLPRVTAGRVVLSPARWRLTKPELRSLAPQRDGELFRTVHAWQASRGMPRLVALVDFDNFLPVDLDNVMSVEAMAHLLRARDVATLVEVFPGPDELCASGPEGRFAHELVVPFVRDGAPGTQPATTSTARRGTGTVRRSFLPGSEWLYAKLYAGPVTIDGVLQELVGPVARASVASGAAEEWFFVRYDEPEWQLRVRFRGQPGRLSAEVLPALEVGVSAQHDQGRLWRMEVDTYQREVERFGGPEAVVACESIFHADSEAALDMLAGLEDGDAGLDQRWRLALRGIDALFDDLGLDVAAKRSVVQRTRERFAVMQRGDGSLRRQLGLRFREERAGLERLLDRSCDRDSPLAPGLAALARRSGRVAPHVAALRELEGAGRLSMPLAALAPSLVHLHANRLLRSEHLRHELAIYDFLGRLYDSQAARAGRR